MHVVSCLKIKQHTHIEKLYLFKISRTLVLLEVNVTNYANGISKETMSVELTEKKENVYNTKAKCKHVDLMNMSTKHHRHFVQAVDVF